MLSDKFMEENVVGCSGRYLGFQGRNFRRVVDDRGVVDGLDDLADLDLATPILCRRQEGSELLDGPIRLSQLCVQVVDRGAILFVLFDRYLEVGLSPASCHFGGCKGASGVKRHLDTLTRRLVALNDDWTLLVLPGDDLELIFHDFLLLLHLLNRIFRLLQDFPELSALLLEHNQNFLELALRVGVLLLEYLDGLLGARQLSAQGVLGVALPIPGKNMSRVLAFGARSGHAGELSIGISVYR